MHPPIRGGGIINTVLPRPRQGHRSLPADVVAVHELATRPRDAVASRSRDYMDHDADTTHFLKEFLMVICQIGMVVLYCESKTGFSDAILSFNVD